MAIDFKAQPDHISRFIKTQGIKSVGWDLDGTLANTEHLHRTICKVALQELSGTVISNKEFGAPCYRSAFGLPAAETSLRLAMMLQENDPQGFGRALRYALSQGFSGTDVEAVGQAISLLRNEIFSFYIRNVKTEQKADHGGIISLKLQCPAEMNDPHLIARRDELSKVHVHTYPFVIEALRVFKDNNLKQGVCTSSGQDFARPLLAAFEIDSYFAAVVTADCVPEGCHKPSPVPWHLLHALLFKIPYSGGVAEPIQDMMFIENSAGGGLSAMRAGAGPTIVVADNIPATIAKLQEKMKRFKADFPGVMLPGTATFIPDLSALVLPSRP